MGSTQKYYMLFKQILKATHQKTAAVWPLASYLSKDPSQMNKCCGPVKGPEE